MENCRDGHSITTMSPLGNATYPTKCELTKRSWSKNKVDSKHGCAQIHSLCALFYLRMPKRDPYSGLSRNTLGAYAYTHTDNYDSRTHGIQSLDIDCTHINLVIFLSIHQFRSHCLSNERWMVSMRTRKCKSGCDVGHEATFTHTLPST